MVYRPFSLMPILGEDLLSDRFTQMDKLFSRITGAKPISEFPSYDLKKKGKERFELIVSVPGYRKEELDISLLSDRLLIKGTVSSSVSSPKEEVSFKWLHRGIERKNFSISFDLDHKIRINHSALKDGLLVLDFSYEIPEREKPRKISIDHGS
ncbi:Hsp20 family protein [Candidatus Riesia pediculischaeffi]|uniref:Heat-shock protein n=2 Tax=Candidatus Riesia pediculischaeffi TaxID=428411 RepID=A0A1V0HJV0_9ENTR|nr:Hsp20 family protein [Candidatus Riesia pediculischaeffi]ARC53104.1 heat-shock protein [Candidatus Riesia pediculischaeffi]